MRRLFIILAFALIPTTGLLARDFYWKGGTGRWSDPTMWELRTIKPIEGLIPSKTDNVFIDKSDSHIFIDNNTEVGNLYWKFGKITGKPETKISSYGMIEIGSSVVDDFEGIWVLKSEKRGTIRSDIKLKGSVHIEAVGEVTLDTPIKTYSDFVIKKGAVTVNSLIECNVLILEENEAYNILVNNATIRKDHLVIRDNPNRKLKINGINLERVTPRDVTKDGELAKGEVYHFCNNTNAQLVIKAAKKPDVPQSYVKFFVIWFDQNLVERGTFTEILPTSGAGAVDSLIVQSTHSHGADTLIRSYWQVSYHNNANATDLPPAAYTIESSSNRHYLSENSVNTAYCYKIVPTISGYNYGAIYIKKNGSAPLKYAMGGEINHDGVFENLAKGTYNVTVTSDSSTCVKDTVIENIVVQEVKPKDLAAVQINTPLYLILDKPNTISFVIFNQGYNSVAGADYTVKLQDTANNVLATANGVDLTQGAQTSFDLTWTPDEVGATEIKGVIVYSEDQNNNNDTATVNVTVVQDYTVTFTVVDTVNNPIEGATIAINQQTLTTNTLGIATIDLINNTYPYTISKEGYVNVTGSAVVNGENVSINETLNLIKYTVTFTVVDTVNSPIEGVAIAINQQALTTNASGIATIDLINNTYPYTVSKVGYVDAIDSVKVNGTNTTVNVTLTYQEYSLELIANPTGGGMVNDSVNGNYIMSAEITVIATPAAGYYFVNWTKGSDIVSINPQFTYTMPTENVTLTANFELIPTYTVTFTVDDATSNPIQGATISINEETLTTDSSGVTTITLEDGTYPYTISKVGYVTVIDSVKVNGADTTVNVTLTYQEYSLELIANPTEGGTVNDSVNGNYIMGAEITVIATPAAGYYFANWTKGADIVSINPQFTYTMPTENVTLTANFEVTPTYTITFTVSNAANALIQGATIAINEETLTTDSSGVTTITLEDGTYPYTVSKVGYVTVIDSVKVNGADITVNVTLTYQEYSLELITNPTEGGTVNDSVNGNYTMGAEITVIATPAAGYYFANWTKGADIVSINPQFTYTMPTENVTLTANFEVTPTYTITFTVSNAANALIQGATIAINEETLTTDSSGVTTITLEDGTYPYTVSKVGYVTVIDSVKVNGADITVNVTLTYQEYSLELITNPTEGGTVNDSVNGNYIMGAEITVIATPATGYYFVNWTKGSDIVSINPQFTYTMPTENVTLTANFELIPTYTVTFTVVDATSNPIQGATIAINEETLTTDSLGVTTITLEDGTYPYTISKVGYVTVIDSVKVNGADTTVNVTLTYQEYTLELIANPTEGGTVNNNVSGTYHMGDSITVIAIPADGYYFINWTKDGVQISTTAQFEYIMPNEDVTLTANFGTVPVYYLTFNVVDIADIAIEDAIVTINSDTLHTNALGVITFALVNGTYSYTVSKVGYVDAVDSVAINGADTTINVTLTYQEYTLTLVANPDEGGTVNSDANGNYIMGDSITVIATPADGYYFINWTKDGAEVDTNAQFTYIMPSEDVILTANFETIPIYNVTFNVVDATNIAIEGATITINSDTLNTDTLGVVTIELENGIFPYTISKAGYITVTDSVVVNGSDTTINITLNYQEFTLILVANPAEGGNVNDSVNGNYQQGDNITVIATPADGYNFINWTKGEDIVSTTAQFDYIMPNEDVTLTANFEATTPTYTVTFNVVDTESNPIEEATVIINSDTLNTNELGTTTITLENGTYPYTVSKAGYDNTTGEVTVSGTDTTVNVTLSLTTQEFTLTLEANPIEGGTVNSDVNGNYQQGDSITIIATPADGYNFINWTKGVDVVSTTAQFDYIMPNEDVTLIANFEIIVVTTYTVTFNVIDDTNSPIEGATITINSEALISNASGIATIVLENGTYPYTVSKEGYVNATGDAVVNGADITVDITLNLQEYTLTLVANPANGGTVNDSVNGNYQQGDNITVIATPADGYCFINWTKDGVEVSTDAEFVYTIPNENVTLTANFEITYTVTFKVYYGLGGPIEDATIVVNGETLITDSLGIAAINLPNGEYSFVLSISGYSDYESSFIVNNEDIEISIVAPPQHFAITFHAEYNGTPLEGVTVSVDGDLESRELTTDEQGNATIELVNGDYTYTATKEGYNDLNGSFVVNNTEQTITLNMTGIEGLTENFVRLYPNPVESSLTIERGNSNKVVIELYNSGGALVGTFKTKNVTTTIDTEILSAGTYLVRIIGTNKTTVHKFIKR